MGVRWQCTARNINDFTQVWIHLRENILHTDYLSLREWLDGYTYSIRLLSLRNTVQTILVCVMKFKCDIVSE